MKEGNGFTVLKVINIPCFESFSHILRQLFLSLILTLLPGWVWVCLFFHVHFFHIFLSLSIFFIWMMSSFSLFNFTRFSFLELLSSTFYLFEFFEFFFFLCSHFRLFYFHLILFLPLFYFAPINCFLFSYIFF